MTSTSSIQHICLTPFVLGIDASDLVWMYECGVFDFDAFNVRISGWFYMDFYGRIILRNVENAKTTSLTYRFQSSQSIVNYE